MHKSSLIVAVLTASSLAPCLTAQSALEQAVTLARLRRYAEASQALRGVTEPVQPSQKVAFHRLKAAIASGLGRAAEAADEMNAALAVSPDDGGLILATAVADLQAGRLDPALARAIQVSDSAQGQELIGDIQEQRGKYVEAAKAYQSAVGLAPDREDYRIRLGLEFAQHYTFEPAVAALREAAPLFPHSARIRILLGVVQYAAGQRDEAIATLTEAVGLDPSLQGGWSYLSTVVLDSTAAPPAATIEALCRWNEPVCGAVELRQSREQNDLELRARALQKLRSAGQDNVMARCELGRAYAWSADWPQARREMEACVSLDPSAQNHYRLGLIYTALNLPDLARDQMKLRSEASAKTTEENERRTSAVRAFQYVLK